MYGYSIKRLWTIHLRGTMPNYEEQIYTSSTTINEIVLQDEDVPVQICNSENGELYLSYYCADDGSEQYKIIEDAGVLTVTKESETNYGIFLFGDQYSSDSYKQVKLTLFIPFDYKENLSVQTLDGDIQIGQVTIADLEVNTKDGDVTFKNTAIRLWCYGS